MCQDTELLRCYAAEGSERAFSELIARHVDLVYSAALRLVNGDTHRAQDVAQQVFVELARQARAVSRHPTLTGWLYTTTRRLALRTIRTEARRGARERAFHRMNETLQTSDENSDWARLRPALDESMHALREPDRLAILLRFFRNKSLREVGATLGLTENAARMRLDRALEKLRTQLARRGIDSTAAALAVALADNAVATAPAGWAATLAGASLAQATLPASTVGILKIMAMTKMQTTAAALALAGAVTALLVVNQWRLAALAERDALRRQMTQLNAANADLSRRLGQEKRSRSLHASASVVRGGPAATGEEVYTNLYDRLDAKAKTITADKLRNYLDTNHRNATSLLAAYRVSHDPALLEEAKKNFPNDPQVAFEAALQTGLSPEEHRQWLDAFEKASPDNALANYLSAGDYFKNGQTEQALLEMAAAAGKAQFQEFTVDRIEADDEAYLNAGVSLVESRQLATTALLLPQLGQIKELALDMAGLAQSYQQAGDNDSAQNVLNMTAALGQRYGYDVPGEPLINELVGIAVQQIALKNMDPNAPFGDNGQTVQDALNTLARQRTQIQADDQQITALVQNLSEQDWMVYEDRTMMFGEQSAVQWLLSKYGQKP